MDLETLDKLAFAKLRTLQLVKDRGFAVEDVEGSIDGLKVRRRAEDLWTQSLSVKQSLAEVASESFQRGSLMCHVIFMDKNYDISKRKTKMVSTDQVKALKTKMNDLEEVGTKNSFIVISPSKWSPQAKKEDFTMFSDVTYFQYEDLSIRIPTHELYVPHVPITLDDLRQKASPYIEEHDLPLIRKTDPVVRWFGFPVGTILEIQRPGFLAYRRVVP